MAIAPVLYAVGGMVVGAVAYEVGRDKIKPLIARLYARTPASPELPVAATPAVSAAPAAAAPAVSAAPAAKPGAPAVSAAPAAKGTAGDELGSALGAARAPRLWEPPAMLTRAQRRALARRRARGTSGDELGALEALEGLGDAGADLGFGRLRRPARRHRHAQRLQPAVADDDDSDDDADADLGRGGGGGGGGRGRGAGRSWGGSYGAPYLVAPVDDDDGADFGAAAGRVIVLRPIAPPPERREIPTLRVLVQHEDAAPKPAPKPAPVSKSAPTPDDDPDVEALEGLAGR